MESIASEKTNRLVDYIEKFANETLATNLAVKSNETRSAISNKGLAGCGRALIDVEKCLPYIRYLDDKKNPQLLRLRGALASLTAYFEAADEKCDHVMDTERCRKLIVSMHAPNLIYFDMNRHSNSFISDNLQT